MSLVNLDCHCCILLGIDNQPLLQNVGSPGPHIKSAKQFRNLKEREEPLQLRVFCPFIESNFPGTQLSINHVSRTFQHNITNTGISMKHIAEQFVLADGSPWDQSNYLLTLHIGVAKDSTVDYSKQLSNTREFLRY